MCASCSTRCCSGIRACSSMPIWRGAHHGAAERCAEQLPHRRRGDQSARTCSALATPASAPRRTCRSSAACHRWCAKATAISPGRTLRNTTKKPMKVEGTDTRGDAAEPEAADRGDSGRRRTGGGLGGEHPDAGRRRSPAGNRLGDQRRRPGGQPGGSDALRVSQRLLPAVP